MATCVDVFYQTYSAGDAAKICGVSQARQRDWRRHGFLPSVDSGHVRYNYFDLSRLFALGILNQSSVTPKKASKALETLRLAISYAFFQEFWYDVLIGKEVEKKFSTYHPIYKFDGDIDLFVKHKEVVFKLVLRDHNTRIADVQSKFAEEDIEAAGKKYFVWFLHNDEFEWVDDLNQLLEDNHLGQAHQGAYSPIIVLDIGALSAKLISNILQHNPNSIITVEIREFKTVQDFKDFAKEEGLESELKP